MAVRNENCTVHKLSSVWCVHCSAKGCPRHVDYLLTPDTNFLYKVYSLVKPLCSSTNMNMEQLQATNNAMPSAFAFFYNIRKKGRHIVYWKVCEV